MVRAGLMALVLSGCVRAGFGPAAAGDGAGGAGDGSPASEAGPGWQMVLPADCSAATWPVTAHSVTVSPAMSLKSVIDAAGPDTTILLEDGTHPLEGGAQIAQERVVLRGASGDRTKVLIDAKGSDIGLQIATSHVVVADLSVVNVRSDAFHLGSSSADISDVVLYNLGMRDVQDHFVHVSAPEGHYVDHGVVGCARITVLDAFRDALGPDCVITGISINGGRGWHIFGNRIQGVWCPSPVDVAAIQLTSGTRDAVVERNVIIDAGIGIRLGLYGQPQPGAPPVRTYPDGGCSSGTSDYVDNYGGVVRNNFVSARPQPDYAFDTGIAIWGSCDTVAVHNTVYSHDTPDSSSIEWRFGVTTVALANNLVSHDLQARDGATAQQQANVTGAQGAWFASPATGDLHLTSAAGAAIDGGAALGAGVCPDDIDGEPRGDSPDVGADER